MPIVSVEPGSILRIGDGVVLCSSSNHTALGVARAIVLRTLDASALLAIGSDTGISGAAICAAKKVQIGSRCLIGADVIIVDTDFHPLNPDGRRYNTTGEKIGCSPVVIEDDVFIGTRAIILKGVTVGRGSVIGAGAVVSSDVPPYCIAAGNPAKVIGKVNL